MVMKTHKSVQDALQYVADHPQMSEADTIDVPAWELIGRTLFQIANHPNYRERGSQARSLKAHKILTDRLVGKRRAGTHPAQQTSDKIEFVDLTSGELT
jgi:hypothetical protein